MSAPLKTMLYNAARGAFPPADGRTDILPAPPGPADAVIAFTGHHVVAANVDPDEIRAQLPPDDIGAPMTTAFLHWLSRRLGIAAGMLDALFVAWPAAAHDLEVVERADLAEHPRVRRAGKYRTGGAFTAIVTNAASS